MTWLSRLFPQNNRLQPVPSRNRTQAKSNRRMATLERLEDRTLLAGQVAITFGLGGPLGLVGNAVSKSFTVAEVQKPGGTYVSLTGYAGTTFKYGAVVSSTWQSAFPVSSIPHSGTASGKAYTDAIWLTGDGQTTAEGVGNVSFTAPAID